MALNLTDLFTIIGKYGYAVNSVNSQFAELETIKNQIFDALEDEGLEDHYTELPAQIETMQTSVSSWIQTFISEIEGVLTDEEFVLENLPIFETSVTAVLNAIFDQMIADSATIQSSVIELGGVDTDMTSFVIDRTDAYTPDVESKVFVSRLLDGVNDPSDLVTAHQAYNNVESQLSKSCTTYAKCISSSAGAEVLQLFSDAPEEDSYTADQESPGVGPTITNVEASNLISSNFDFTDWSGNNPTDWTLANSTAGTGWVDVSTTGVGPLEVKVAGVTLKRQLTLERRTSYFFGFQTAVNADSGLVTVKMRIESVDGGTVYKDFGSTTYNTGAFQPFHIYGFYAPADGVNLNDIYICLEYDAETSAPCSMYVYKAVVAPVTYYNGLGFVFWNALSDEDSVLFADWGNIVAELPEDSYGSILVENDNAGKFQEFFRKAFNIQLPTADSPTIPDSLIDF